MILSAQPQLHPIQLLHHRAPKVADKRMERALVDEIRRGLPCLDHLHPSLFR